MSADVSIYRSGPVPAPLDYTVPLSGAIRPVVASGSFNGAATVATWSPALQVVHPNGTVLATIPLSASIAAGGSADATWGPFLRRCPQFAGWPNTVQSDTVLAFGPWAFWKLNEANSVSPAVDSSGHGRSLTVRVADVIGGRSGIVPTSGDTSSFVTWNAATNLTPWVSVATQLWNPAVGTWEYWLNCPGHSTNELNLGCHGTVSSATTRLFRHFLNASGQPVLEFQDTLGTLHTLTTAVGVVDNSTHQLVFVLDGTNLTVYVDGAQAGQQAQGAAMKTAFTATLTLGMALGGSGSRYYTGLLEHAAWYDQVLSAANVLALFNAGTKLPS